MNAIATLAVGTIAAAANAQCTSFIDFESFVPGTEWGAPAYAPGDLAFSEEHIDVTLWPHSNGLFNFARIDPDPTGGGCGLVHLTLGMNNINTMWDVTQVPGNVDRVKLRYAALGGSIDLRVNDGPMWTGGDLSLAPGVIAPGVTLVVNQIGPCGTLEFYGSIKSIEIGGQELWIDDVCAFDCYADINDDGVLDILDFVAFQNIFTDGGDAADCNGDGVLNILDFVCFQNEFMTGC